MSGNRFILVLGIILGLTACGEHAMDKDYSAMNTMPLRTECVGRLLVDLPQHGFKGWSADFDWAEVSRMRINVPTATSFWTIVEERKQELESQKHDLEPSMLSAFQKVGDMGAMILFRDHVASKSTYRLERYLWLGHRGYKFESKGIPNEDRDHLGQYSEIFTKLKPRSNIGIPQESGFCIDGALVTGDVGEISALITIRAIPGWKHVFLEVGLGETGQDKPVDDPDDTPYKKLEEKQQHLREAVRDDPEFVNDPIYPKEFEVLRKRERALSGIAGQEIAYRKRLNNGATIYKFNWADIGPGGTPQRPGVGIGMDVGEDDKPDDKPPSEENLFALWDAVLATLRQRPGAL